MELVGIGRISVARTLMAGIIPGLILGIMFAAYTIMKGVAPEDVSIQDICWAAAPYVIFDILVIALIIIWPSIALWLPSQIAG